VCDLGLVIKKDGVLYQIVYESFASVAHERHSQLTLWQLAHCLPGWLTTLQLHCWRGVSRLSTDLSGAPSESEEVGDGRKPVARVVALLLGRAHLHELLWLRLLHLLHLSLGQLHGLLLEDGLLRLGEHWLHLRHLLHLLLGLGLRLSLRELHVVAGNEGLLRLGSSLREIVELLLRLLHDLIALGLHELLGRLLLVHSLLRHLLLLR